MKAIRKFINTIREGLKGIWKHKNLGFVSVVSTFLILFIVGIIILISVNVNNIALKIQTKVNDVEIFINKETNKQQEEKMKTILENIKIKKTIKYRSSEDALRIMKKSWGKESNLLDNIVSKDLLPASYIVKIDNINEVEDFIKEVKKDKIMKPYIEDVKYYKDLVNDVYKTSNSVKIFSTVLIVILMIVSFFVISNTIKLTLMSRLNEIAVMKYVGATNGYIRVPFIIEGMFFGFIASVLAYLAIYYSYDYVFYNFGKKISESIALLDLLKPSLIQFSLLKIFLSLGLGIGVLGSVFAIRKYLYIKEVKYVK